MPLQALQVAAQPVSLAVSVSEEVPGSDSCSLLVSQDSSHAFVRVLPVNQDSGPVEVEITIQVDGHEPCETKNTVPVELYFPKTQLTVKVVGKDKKIPFRFVMGDTYSGPRAWMMQTHEACVTASESGFFKLGCWQGY